MTTAAYRKSATSKTAPGRINARLSAEDVARVQELATLTQQSTSNVVREAVREYHAKHVKPRRSAYEIMLESGFIGRYEGTADSSSKESIHRVMGAVLRAKYAQHDPAAKRPRERKAS